VSKGLPGRTWEETKAILWGLRMIATTIAWFETSYGTAPLTSDGRGLYDVLPGIVQSVKDQDGEWF
jgi:hypothetical protein